MPKEKANPLSKFTDDELYAELEARRADKNLLEIKHLNINGITTKDFVVYYADWTCGPTDPNFKPTFSFALKHGKKEYCIYYDFNEEKPKKWWPVREVDNYGEKGYENAAREFIPNGFSESCENSYDYDGTTEEAIECLKKHGFTTIKNDQKRTTI